MGTPKSQLSPRLLALVEQAEKKQPPPKQSCLEELWRSLDAAADARRNKPSLPLPVQNKGEKGSGRGRSRGGEEKARKSKGNATYDQNSPDLSAPGSEPERHLQAGALGAAQPQAGDSAFHVVSVESFRVRLLDTDNLVPKWHVDALRYAGLLPSDAPDKCRIVTSQTKVSRKDEEKTVITIEAIS